MRLRSAFAMPLLHNKGQTLDLLANYSTCHVVKNKHSYRIRSWIKFGCKVNPECCVILVMFLNIQDNVVFFQFSERNEQQRDPVVLSTSDRTSFLAIPLEYSTYEEFTDLAWQVKSIAFEADFQGGSEK